MGKSATWRLLVALSLCLAGAGVSGLLLLQHHGEDPAVSAVNEVCGDGQTSGCADVARSSWSSVAGFPVAGYGLVFYLSVALLLALGLLVPDELKDPLAALVMAGLALGLLVDLLLLGVQALAIKAFCSLCILTYVLSAGALLVLLPARKGASGLVPAARRPEGRLALGGWLLGTLAVIAAVVSFDQTLGHRALQRQAHLLGGPVATAPLEDGGGAGQTPSATPSPLALAPEAAGTPSPPDAAYWRDRAQKLQETLDDPRKLDQYFAEKARKEYAEAPVTPIDLEGVPFKGPTTAPVKVVAYSDFMCPFCRSLAQAFGQFVPQAGGRVAVYFKNYPLDKECNTSLPGSTHAGACWLARGAVCAHAQGRFDAYHDKAFASELKNPTADDVARLAGEAGLDAALLGACLFEPGTRDALAAQIEEGRRVGITATPTVFVNGKRLPRINDFVAVVDQEARKKGFAPLVK